LSSHKTAQQQTQSFFLSVCLPACLKRFCSFCSGGTSFLLSLLAQDHPPPAPPLPHFTF
jgi:hypothetical protein